MIAGTLAQLTTPINEPLDPYIRNNQPPALTVTNTQTTHDDATPQYGTIAGRVKESVHDVYAGVDEDGDPYIDEESGETVTTIATDWYADVTGAGIVLAESVAANEELPFPFDVFGGITETEIERQQIDIRRLFTDWDDDALDIWMAGNDERGASMAYHGSADGVEPTIGIGFVRAWNGTTIKGVAWASGYVALYSARHAADGLQFVADEILPYTETWDPEEHEDQADFDDFGGGA